MSGTKHNNHVVSERVQQEQVRLLYAAMPMSILATVVNSVILVAFQWRVIDHVVLVIWLVSILGLTLLRAHLVRAYHRRNLQNGKKWPWFRLFRIGLVLSAIIWGASTILLFPDEEVGNQMLVAFVIAGMTAGATTSLSYQRSLILIFLAFTLIPLSIRFFMQGDGVSLAMGSMILLFFLMMSIAGVRNYRNIVENIRLRIDADIREQKLCESEEKYRHIFNSSPLGIAHYNEYGVVTDYNGNFLELLRVSKAALKNLDLINDINDKELQNAVSQSLSGKLSAYEGLTKAIAGQNETDIRIFFRGMHNEDGIINGGVAILEDISEDKRIKKIKDEFISTISHELRTPLTAIKGAIGLIQGGVVGEVSESAHDMLDITDSNTERLLLLINDILDIDKIESGSMKFDMKSVDVMELVEEAVKATNVYAKQYDVTFLISQRSEYLFTLGDRQRLMQVMYNLLSNAAKFSNAGSIVKVLVKTTGDNIIISVVDQGGGIPKSFQDKIFERFTQADSTDSRRGGGTGLGLNISKKIIEKHQGDIYFTSNEMGTTFNIRLIRSR